jgi:hypothetical protein
MAKLQSFQLAGLQGHTYVVPEILEHPQPEVADTPLTIDDVIELALSNIDQAAGIVRLKYITSAPGQTEIYLEKTEEAIDYTVAGYPEDASSYPFIVAEANASGITCREAAEMIIKKKSLWLGKAAKIEEVRRTGKITIRQLKSVDDVASTEKATIVGLNAI